MAINVDIYKCLGDMFALNCVVNGSTLVWSSEEYIGQGGVRLEFGNIIRDDKLPFTISSPTTTTNATLHTTSPLMSTLFAEATQDGTIFCIDDSGVVHLNVTIMIGKYKLHQEIHHVRSYNNNLNMLE